MRTLSLILLSALSGGGLKTQSLPLEVMTGQRYVWYQQQISAVINKSGLGYFHVSSLQQHYQKEFKTEFMSQSYLSYRLLKHVKGGLGIHYLDGPGLRPSFHLQLALVGKKYLLLAVPRTHLSPNPAYDVMLLAEYKPATDKGPRLYARYQALFSYKGRALKRSYQHLRAGVAVQKIKAGLAFNIDTYGLPGQYCLNYGFFIRKDVF